MQNKIHWILFFVVFIFALALRLPRLTQRPMHTDEAVHAMKFGDLLEKNDYRYDPFEYHGPTLNYFTLIPAWISSAKNITQINEVTLRIVPVFFGLLLVLFLLLLKDGLSWPVVLWGGLFTAVSPAMVFYSRYYIQEMLLVAFSFAVIAAVYRYLKNNNFLWALTAGISVGLMYATKETCVIAFFSMTLAAILTGIVRKMGERSFSRLFRNVNLRHILAGAAAALIISILFYSSFFTHPRGVLDSLLTFKNYLGRGAGHQAAHIHPWYYYFKILLFSKYPGRPLWSEAFIVLLALAGLLSAVLSRRKRIFDAGLHYFISFYAIIMILIYSAIPYKTPWSMLGFYHGLILLAAIGTVVIFNTMRRKVFRTAFILVLAMGSGNLVYQSILSNYKYEADPSNPYVYAHTSMDVFKITKRVEEIASASKDGKNMIIEVICPGNDYWPLPWYLRAFPNVGWYSSVDFNSPVAPLYIASPVVEDTLLQKIYETPPPGERNLYVPLFDSYIELRPNVEIRGYVAKYLWDAYWHKQGNGQREPENGD
ncbi:MAG: TIGR03663 family protein [Calditrichaeota bacterium]|nr:TIGR03663 family protein [Calditrichota bacterium]